MSKHYPEKKEFVELASEGNVIPVYREILADLDTPISAFMKIAREENSYLLESVEGGENVARYSFLGSSPSLVISARGKEVIFDRRGKITRVETEDPIETIKDYMSKFKFVGVKGLPRFTGGIVGYAGYDIVRHIEDIPQSNPDELNMPDMMFMLTDTILVFDHVGHKIKAVSNCLVEKDTPEEAYEKAIVKIDALVSRLSASITDSHKLPSPTGEDTSSSNFSEKEFCDIVGKAQKYIVSGDIIQVVLSQRIKKDTGADTFSVYRALRSINPSPYMYYIRSGDSAIIGSSPEILVRCEDRVVTTRPIAGTRKRTGDIPVDGIMEKELLSDPKEKAEHIMLVDLGRNDIGRVCEYGSIVVDGLMSIEKYSHVMHMVTGVSGILRKDKDVFDLLRAVFPAGTVSGAPKVRAMQIIDELENRRRGPYAGCLGYISFSGNMDMCITIRTIVMKGKTAFVQAGAGIVMDSEPELEYK